MTKPVRIPLPTGVQCDLGGGSAFIRQAVQSNESILRSRISELEAQVENLKAEVRVLRQFGNKDCTAMADEELAKR